MDLLVNQSEAKKHLLPYKVGALFMEMGTGKTRVAIELVNDVDNIDGVFWIAPLRTIEPLNGLPSVKDELLKWGGFNAPTYFTGIESLQNSDRIYLNLRQKIESCKNPFIIIDESLKIKNIEAKRTQRMFDLGTLAEHKLILNGTPLSKSLLDIWSQMQFLSPLILNMSYAEFKDTFCEYTTITKRFGTFKTYSKEFITGYENIDYLYSLIRHYVFETNLELGIKQIYTELNYKIDYETLEQYKFLKEKYLDNEKLQWLNNKIFLELTQKMQHLYCCTEDKFTKVNEWFNSGIDPKKTIIFCKYVKSQEECKKVFSDCRILSYQKESLGLNLQDYPNTIFWDKNWDFALRKQAIARTFRTGQEYDCKYLDITGNVGLEKLIDNNIKKKIGMAEYFKNKTKEQIKSEL